MKFYYFFLLLLVVLSAYSESLQPSKSPDSFDPTPVTVHPNSISAQLGVLAPVLPQNEVYRITLPQNEVYKIALPQHEVYKVPLPQNKVYTWWRGPLLCMACKSQPCFYFNFKTEELVHS